MSWHILGAGSLGCLWAARLQLAGHPTQLIMRPQQLDTFARQGSRLHFTTLDDQQHQLHLNAQSANTSGNIDRLLVTTKAHSAATAVASVRHRLHADSQLILLQNGIGSQQEVADLANGQRILLASTTEGAYLNSPFSCIQAGAGQTLIGDLQPGFLPAPYWLTELQQAGIPCQWQADIQPILWRKLAINCLINPLTVIHHCPNGALEQHESLIRLLAVELESLLIAAGQPAAAERLADTALQVIRNTAANRSSMLQDVQQHRRTEISYITGFALEQCSRLALDCPHLKALHQQLQACLQALGLPDN